MTEQISNKSIIGRPFIKGEKTTGRKPGVSNKTTKAVREVYAEVFEDMQAHPHLSLKAWALKKPTEFYKLAGKIIPNQVRESMSNIK